VPRRGDKLQNMNGEEMTVDDYLRCVRDMKAGKGIQIKNFGF